MYIWAPQTKGEDITGDGTADLLLCEHTGGNSFGYMLLELTDGGLRETLRLSGQPSHCEDADGDGVWEYYTTSFSGTGHRPQDYKMQRLDRLTQDQHRFEPWRPEWLDQK